MKSYRTMAIIRLYEGKIGLTDDQAMRRMDCLSKIEDGVFDINQEIVFKAGEVISLEDAPKPYRKSLECLEPRKPAIEAVAQETVEAEEKPVAKKRKYTKRSKA